MAECPETGRETESATGSTFEFTLEDAFRGKLQETGTSELNILVIGMYGVGKSTLINTMFLQNSERKAEVGKRMEPCTKAVQCYSFEVGNLKINVYDSPGLQDGNNDDRSYITEYEEACKNYHLIIYCSKMGEELRPCEETALRDLASAFGNGVWKKFAIALTCANQVDEPDGEKTEDEHFKTILNNKTERLRCCLNKIGCKDEKLIVENRIYPVGSKKKSKLPTIDCWRENFWQGCLEACQLENGGNLLKRLWKYKPYLKNVAIVAGVGVLGVATGGAAGYVGAATVGKTVATAAVVASKKIIVGAAVGGVGGVTVGGIGAYFTSKKEKPKTKTD